MEKHNTPVINVAFNSAAPGADIEVFERYQKWSTEVYLPMQMKVIGLKGIDFYHVIRENLEYPVVGVIYHWENLQAWETFPNSPKGAAISQEAAVWVKRGVRDPIWSVVYELIKSYRSLPLSSTDKPDTRIENAPVMSLEAFRLSPEDKEKYVNWFTEYGYSSFIPLFVRLPGFKGYDWYKYTGLTRSQDVREHEYPKYLSIIYFENTQAFDNFVKSPELAAFFKVMRSVFPRSLRYGWYVQYQLVQSWRK